MVVTEGDWKQCVWFEVVLGEWFGIRCGCICPRAMVWFMLQFAVVSQEDVMLPQQFVGRTSWLEATTCLSLSSPYVWFSDPRSYSDPWRYPDFYIITARYGTFMNYYITGKTTFNYNICRLTKIGRHLRLVIAECIIDMQKFWYSYPDLDDENDNWSCRCYYCCVKCYLLVSWQFPL